MDCGLSVGDGVSLLVWSIMNRLMSAVIGVNSQDTNLPS